MTVTKWIWLVLAAIYITFFSWYTSFQGPLTAEEIDHYLALSVELNPDAPPEYTANLRKFMEDDTGDDFVMINVIDMYDRPLQVEGGIHGSDGRTTGDGYYECRRHGGMGLCRWCTLSQPP
jgi:hypothetical protein